MIVQTVTGLYCISSKNNTNGQGSLINGRDIAPELQGLIDTVSISLNNPDAENYQEIVRSKFGTKGYEWHVSWRS